MTVNPVLDIDQYPLPKPDDIFATLSGGQKFTTLDLSHAYNQLLLDEAAQKFVTINTHKGLFRYSRLPFGIASAPAIFQRTMDTILQDLKGVACYIDDIIITGQSDAEHLDRLEEVLRRLQRHGIRAKWAKCKLFKSSVNFLGHRIDKDGVHPTTEKLEAIVRAPAPRNIQQLRSFLGLINYYGKFIPNASTILNPLNKLLRKDTPWNWSKECQTSFESAKKHLVSTEVLTHYTPSLPIRMAGDASSYGIRAVIAHIFPDGSERPVVFASSTLTDSERNYSQVEKEALSLIFGVKRFHTYLYGRKFTLVTDHKPLTTILSPKKGISSLAAARLQRWAWILSAYSYDIEFRGTGEHANADGLSHLPVAGGPPDDPYSDPKIFSISQMESLPVTIGQLRAATRSDRILSKVYQYTRNGWPEEVSEHVKPYSNRRNELMMEEGCVLWGFRVIIPNKLRDRILVELHRDHPGVTRMKSVARSYLWWPGLDKDLENMVKGCQACQSVKKAPSVVPLHPWVWPSRPWQRVHLDFAGPFQGSMFFVGVDAYSKWPEVRIMNSTTASKTLDILREWFAFHGVPEHLVTENGPQFVSEEFELFTRRNGIKHIKSAPYHPASNGLAERFIQSLKHSLKASQRDGRSLSQRVSSYLLSYRSTTHATTGVAPCKLLMQRDLRTRFHLLQPSCEKSVLDRQAQQKLSHDQRARVREWNVGACVMVFSWRPGPDWIAGTVKEVLGPVTYIVETDDGHRWKRHADQIKSWIESVSPGVPSSAESAEVLPSVPATSADLLPEGIGDHTSEAFESNVAPSEPMEESARTDSVDEEVAPLEVSSPSASMPEPDTDAAGHRYPSRNRRPPDRFK